MKNEAEKIDKPQGNGVLPCVTNRYLFWFEHEGKEGWTFEIEAKNYDEAFEKAYDTYGPQVEDMMYQWQCHSINMKLIINELEITESDHID